MAQQKLTILNSNGADQRRVLDMLTPLNGETAPAVNATFLGQTYVDTAEPAIYQSVAVGSEVAANDWIKMTTAV